MTQADEWTIGRLLEWTTGFLKSRGSESPRLDAEVLLAEARGCPRIELYTAFTEIPSEEVRTAFRELVKRRAEGMPVAYLVGRREFYSLSFQVTPDVLIPRPETEFLVIRLLDLIKQREAPAETLRLADVGTGSGVIAVCAAKRVANLRATAIDQSAQALDVATSNAVQHGVQERMEFIESDLFAAVPAGRKFDYIVSNPPYVTTREMASLARDVRDFEPRQALEAGPRGTEVIERLIPQAAERLKTGGWLLIEISPQLDLAVRALIEAEPRLTAFPTGKDLAGHARVIQSRRK